MQINTREEVDGESENKITLSFTKYFYLNKTTVDSE